MCTPFCKKVTTDIIEVVVEDIVEEIEHTNIENVCAICKQKKTE